MKKITYFCKNTDDQVYGGVDHESQSRLILKSDEWLNKAAENVCIETEFAVASYNEIDSRFLSLECLINNSGTVELDDVKYVTNAKAKLVSDLAEYRWAITHGVVDSDIPVSYMNGFPIFHTEEARFRLLLTVATINKKLSNGSLEDDDTKRFKSINGAWIDVVVGDVIDWTDMLVDTEQIFFDKEELVQEAIDELETKAEVESYDVKSELDNLVKPVLFSDLTKHAYPIKYHLEDQ